MPDGPGSEVKHQPELQLLFGFLSRDRRLLQRCKGTLATSK